ncbi:DNA helicase-2/ATP-dependent DNA helicase PcrA [Methylobacterium fujisawaense]|uniref:DNA 3'-5' helicase n=1 Tax=Methylobacterium fujisawaense TaxID=107400 RepID=A0ABR6DCN6_9HYPH|nr:ATP-dependent helicase [Methylobacterium fujisawaense]MBA9063847.1 DNA helicase-2/ATP-dependent DNA helicase PcrA [Methylobacterium fujisawaense]
MRLRSSSAAYLRHAGDLADNPGQQAAYDSQGHCVVLAGPGSGKTKTLILKLARMLAEDVRVPQGVACITYSQECARELKRRLEPLGLGEAQNLFVGTVHGFCLRHILMPYAHLADIGLPRRLAVATNRQADVAFKVVAERLFGLNQPHKRDDMGRYRRVHLDREAPDWEADPDLARISEGYEATLRRQGLIDYDDMVVCAHRLVSAHDWVLPAIAARWPILAVDEYQDLGVPLHRIVTRLAFEGGVRLFAVGDADQSVYGFAGSDGDLLLELAERHDIQRVRLELNYRCAGRIIEASEYALGETRGYRPYDEERLAVIRFVERPGGLADQAAYVIDTLIPEALAAKDERKLGDIAILYRNAAVGNAFADALMAAGIDFVRVDTGAPYRKVELTSWIEDCAGWCSGGWRRGRPQLDGLLTRWVRFRTSLSSEREANKAKNLVTAFLMRNRRDDGPAAPFVAAIRRDLVDPLAREEPSLHDQMEQVHRMGAAVTAGGKLEGLDLVGLGGRDGSPSHINLLTLHSSKGCEYDVVMMVGMDQGVIPWNNESGAELRESRRLFYVGLTRARDAVHLIYSGWIDGRYGPRTFGRSSFVEELETRLLAAGQE